MPRVAGYSITTDPGSDRPIDEADYLQCAHCSAQWRIKPGSGNVRGFCGKCNGPVCGPKCAGICRPTEVLLENLEAGRPPDHVTTREPVKLWLPGSIGDH